MEKLKGFRGQGAAWQMRQFNPSTKAQDRRHG
ncbi:MAG: hypothetical protein ACI9FU_001381, partial [Granulosicoccus sp.]